MDSQAGQTAFDVAVVGAGAAGQMAAIAAAEEGRRVVLLEQMARPGLKILASGGGHCNLTNLVEPAVFIAAFGRQGRFMTAAMTAMGPTALRSLLASLGVPTIVRDRVYVWPASERSADVQAAHRRRIEQLGVTLRLGCLVRSLWIDSGRLMGVETASAERIAAEAVVLACGGKSWPTLGGTGGGYSLAGQAGMAIVEPLPALVALVTREQWPGRLAGVSLHNVRVRIELHGQDKTGLTGDVLMTERGISGPVVLNISGRVSQLLQQGPVPLRIELEAGIGETEWVRRLEGWRSSAGRRNVVNMLREHLPRSLCEVLCELAGVEGQTTMAQLPAANRDALAGVLGGLELTVTATEGFETAFVTRGGVKLQGVNPNTLESRSLAGLYLAGELLDLDGPSGGFNLQWAFASGWLAGKSAGRR
ncbi:MAG: aminoacetone oxidase family FAD-binding enzyme [Planctomycetes bacterium]|nr:aminoacetone oxidase family FAD-binding enzyme [Planctomycetota bacterium]